MASNNFDNCLTFVLQFEGGYVNHPDDPGGPTNLGITQSTLSSFIGRQATIEEVKALTPAKVAPIYRLRYWDRVQGDDLPAGVDLAVFDFGVHSGPTRSVMSLQRVLGVADDGKLGPVTLTAANAASPLKTVNALCDARLDFLMQLKVFQSFGPGLTNRVSKCRAAALDIV